MAVLCLIEFLTDKISVVDSIWDAIHTFIRVPTGAVLTASALAHFNLGVRAVVLLAGGTLALGSHGTKATVRMTVNASPQPFSIFTIGLAVLAAFHPFVILAIILVFLFLLVWLGPRVFGAIRSMPRHLGDMGLARQHSCKASLFGRIVPGLFSFDQHKFPTT